MQQYAVYEIVVNSAGETLGFERWTYSYNEARCKALADKWCEDHNFETTFICRKNDGAKLNYKGERTHNYFIDALNAGLDLR